MAAPPYILGIETSCDETACALVDRDGRVRINAVSSQVDLHALYGGVVPELASRRHIETCLPLIESTLAQAGGVGWDEIAGVAVTQGPGMIGCLLIGIETAKALAWRYDKPLYAVHHLEAHLYAPSLLPDEEKAAHLLIENGEEKAVLPMERARSADPGETEIRRPEYPNLGLVVSGGHTSLVLVESPDRCRQIAATRDDAVGEAYDKVARLLGLGYPGGPPVDRLAAEGDPREFPFTPPLKRRDVLDFSFSGLKSAVARRVERLRRDNGSKNGKPLGEKTIRDLCAGFQSTVIEVLLFKALRAARSTGVRDLLIVGGVASNRGLRKAAREASSGSLRIWFPHFSLCTDNAAMIAGLAWRLQPLERNAALELDPSASLRFSLEG